ncbi:MAG: ATP-binding protein [Anaerolineales bacterium]|nr:ATP-binding protein [Anaerolineales bacterium]
MFINREAELTQLENLYATGRAELFILYGRRRVGKTELLRAFCEGKPHIFFIATLSSDRDQLATFSQEIYRLTHTEVPEGFTFPSWEAALRALVELPGRPVVVLDEFTYLIGGNKAIPSILQKVWDETLRNSQVLLILCGSYIGMMETEVMGYNAPLYGRRSGSLLLESLELLAVPAFFPNYTPAQQIEAWAVLGGMPYYLTAFSDRVDIFANIRRHILDVQGLLYPEPRLLLLEELREPRNYFSILRAIAQGRTRLNEIALGAGVGDSPVTARYLDLLQQMRLVYRSVPATESQPEKSKKGIYHIVDPFLRFWFRYVHPYQSSLDLGMADGILAQRVRPTFDQFVGYAFEQAARAYIARLARKGSLPFLPERIGAWWDQSGEMDVVAVSDNEKVLLVGECKWSANAVGSDVLEDLKSKAQTLLETGRWNSALYFLFAKSGFTPAVQEQAANEGIRLVTVEDCFV